MRAKVAFIHGRPGPHPIHERYARLIGADFFFVDSKLRWQDIPRPRWWRYLSWLVCALTFPSRHQYNVFLTEGPHFPPLIMKWLRLLKHDQKVVVFFDNETLYFLKTNFYPRLTTLALLNAIKSFDAAICVGKMQHYLLKELLKEHCPLIYTIFNGVPKERTKRFQSIKPNLRSSKILFIGHGTGGWRIWYKGLDLMLQAFKYALKDKPELEFFIVGRWEKEAIRKVLEQSGLQNSEQVKFVGPAEDLEPFLAQSSLYLHCGRGEAWGVSILEAMCAGLPAIVSEWTGAKEVVEKVDPRLVVPLDPKAVAQRILWYFSLSLEERCALGERGRRVVLGQYTEEKANEIFLLAFRRMLDDLGLGHLKLPREE